MGGAGSKRDELLKIIREGHGLASGEFLEETGLKGNRSGGESRSAMR